MDVATMIAFFQPLRFSHLSLASNNIKYTGAAC